MKTFFPFAGTLPILFLCSCFPTRIVTTSPSVASSNTVYSSYTTTTRNGNYTRNQVRAISADISLNLDLQAVSAAFAQSSNVEQFENILNDDSNAISNLDLNGDGYVDYLRVLETIDGLDHIFLIQAVLGENIYQDVATIAVEGANGPQYSIEIMGDPFIYGPAYYLRPVYHTRPLILVHICSHHYEIWRSPWHWDHFHPRYRPHPPIFIHEYHNHVVVYMRHHGYCHSVDYPHTPHYRSYDRVASEMRRNDYGTSHPERSFSTRTANLFEQGEHNSRTTANTRNARDIQQRYEAQMGARTDSGSAGRNTGTGSSTRSSNSSTRSGTSSSSTRSSNNSTSSSSNPGNTTRSSSSSNRSSVGSTTSSSSSTNTINSGSSTRTGVSSSSTRSSSSSTRSGVSSSSTNNSGNTSNTTRNSSSSNRSSVGSTSSSTRSSSSSSSSNNSSRSGTTSSSTRSSSSSTSSARSSAGGSTSSRSSSSGTRR